MSLRRSLLLIATLTGFVASVFGTGAAQADATPDMSRARPLTSDEVYQHYNSRSWLWSAGAGYFSVKKRQFTAYSREGSSPSYATGRWFITSPGKLCFRATWHAQSGSAPAVTCFGHREINGVIYQKREPNGEWYVFRGVPARRSDEWAKLRRGDYVISRMTRIQSRLAN